MIRNSLKPEYDLEFLMKTENGNFFVGWKLVIEKDLLPDLLGKYWFDPMTGERELSQYAYQANHMEDRSFGKPYEASLLWKVLDSDVKKFKPIKSPKEFYAKNRRVLSSAWKKCWGNKESEYNDYAKGLPYDSSYTNHFLVMDNFFEVENPFKAINDRL